MLKVAYKRKIKYDQQAIESLGEQIIEKARIGHQRKMKKKITNPTIIKSKS